MPNPAFDVSYRAVSAFYRVASAAPSGARLYHQYAKKLGGNSFLVLFRAHIEEALSKAATPSVFVVNMSGFGAVNESYGHDGGNQFLEKAEAHIYQFFKAQGMDVAVSRSGINFVVVAKGLRSDLAKKTLTDLQAYLGAPERSYKVKVAAKYVTRDGGVRGEVQNRFLGEKGNYDVELRKAPLFNGRKRKRVNFPSFYVGLLEGEKNLSSASYQEAVEKVITSVNVRSNDPTQPKVHTYQIANLVEPEEGIPLFVNQADIRACQDLLVEEREAAGVWQLAQTSNPVLEDLLQWLNFDTKTGALTQNAFESKLDEIYATKASYTLASVDINAFGSFNFTFNSDKSVLGKLLGDHAVNVLCQLFDQAFAKAGISATVYRTGGDELQVLSKKTAPILGAALKRTLPAILEAAAQDSDLELKIPENKVDSEMRLKLAAQGIRPKNGIYSINIFSLERISPKYAGKVFTGLSISLGIIPISNFERPAHEYMKDADGMAECAKKQAGAVRIHYDHRIAQEDRRADKKSHSSVGRRYVNGG